MPDEITAATPESDAPPATNIQPPATSLIEAVRDRLDQKLMGYRVRYVDQPIPGPGIKQVYRVEKFLDWPLAMDDAGLEIAHRVADDLAQQIVKFANRGINQELVSWDGDIPHTVDAGDRAHGIHCSVRVTRHFDHYDIYIDRNRYSVRFDVIFRLKDLPRELRV